MQTTFTTALANDAQEYILQDCAEAIIHSTPEFAAVLKRSVDGEPAWIVAEAGGEPVGMLPFFLLRLPAWGTLLNSYPYYGAHGGCLVRRDAPAGEVRRGLLRGLREVALSQPDFLSASISLSFLEYDHHAVYDEAWQPDFVDMRRAQLYAIPQQDCAQTVMARHSTARTLRKALRQQFVIAADDSDAAWTFLQDRQERNMQKRGGLARTPAQMEALRRCLGPGQRTILVARHPDSGDLAAALLVMLHHPWVHYGIPVTEEAYASQQPMTALIYEALCRYGAQGYTRWSFGGTPLGNENLHRFKAAWGATDAPYAYMGWASARGRELFAAHPAAMLQAAKNYYVLPRTGA